MSARDFPQIRQRDQANAARRAEFDALHFASETGEAQQQSRPTRRPTLNEPVVIAEWWKNRGGETIRVRLSTYESHNLIDVRTWYAGDDGRMMPGKGFAAAVKHLPRLVRELTKAEAKAHELGLIDDPEGGSDAA